MKLARQLRRFFAPAFFAAFFVAILPDAARAVDSEKVDDKSPDWLYTVRPGDTLIGIGEHYFAQPQAWRTIQKVQRDNRIADPHRLVPGTVLRIPVSVLRRAPAQATLEAASGAVRWRAGDGAWQEAGTGQKLDSGTELETAENASAVLRLADGSRLALTPGSTVLLDALTLYAGGLMADTRLRLQRGQAEISANPAKRGNRHLRILTPSAQAVVRGTRFRVGFETDTTREETLEGAVGVAAAGTSVNVPGGRGTLARAGEAPLPPVALLAAADVSSLPGRFEQLPLRFPLPAMAGAQSWVGQVAPDERFDRILLQKTTSAAALAFSDLPNGDYVLRLRALDGNGLQGRDALHRFTVFARPFPPGLDSPGQAAKVRAAQPPFAWTPVRAAARYRLQVARQADFSRPLHDSVVEGGAWQPPAALPEGKLYWRVASISAGAEQGPWGATGAFSYSAAPGAADLGRAALKIDTDRIALNLPSPPDGMAYEAMLAADTELAQVLAQTQSADGQIEFASPGHGSYTLGVRLVDKSDNTPGPAAIQKIEVPASRLWWLLVLLPLML
ncbi:MAG: FecR domain-containing protein [Betaproteobacteria bacterium]|nr:FecR domain-containing protein [Betaproteobacteria bacterium]